MYIAVVGLVKVQDVVYGGNAFIFENGSLLEQSERFQLESQLVISEIDVERLRSERRTNSTFVNAQRPVAGLNGITRQIGELAFKSNA